MVCRPHDQRARTTVAAKVFSHQSHHESDERRHGKKHQAQTPVQVNHIGQQRENREALAHDNFQCLGGGTGYLPAIPLNGKDLSGKAVSLSDFAGKVVLLHFWGSWARESAEIADVLVEARNDFGDKGLVMLGVAIDEDRAQAAAAAKEAGMDWRHIFDGKVWMTDAALRYSVQNVPSYVLIGKDGKVAGLRMFLRDENGVGDFRQLVENALK